jgi:hypothetical protein
MLDKALSTVDNKRGENAPPFCDKICFLIFNDLFRPTKSFFNFNDVLISFLFHYLTLYYHLNNYRHIHK